MSQTYRATWAQCRAEMLRTIRNRRFVFFSILMPAAFFFIFTGTMDGGGMHNWAAYYLMSMTSYGVVGASLVTFSQRVSRERAQGWIRLLRMTPLPSGAYVLSKAAAQGAINIGLILVLFLTGGLSKSIDLPASVWIEAGLWIWAGGFAFMALGMLLGTMRNSDVVQVLATILYMSLSIVGGLWMPTSAMPQIMQTIAKFTPTYRMGQGPWALIGGQPVDWSGIGVLAVYMILFMVVSAYIMKKQEAV
ncbi:MULTISPECIES: ABC transporter permease [Paenibacillus]|uniref:ABC transporter permease n=1 Tax=Paenibacillus TaxID=44249 RepID=UPI00038F3FB2|nr:MULTISPECIES: ABC transporter permease [Paenibacillus]CDN42785.1 Putative transport permease YvfS [Paenibacillus sp. P22]